MRILVTGGAGFIGSHLTKTLLDDGHHVYVIDNFSTGYKKNVDTRATLIEADLVKNKKIWLEKIEEVEVIYHLAAQPRIQPSLKFPVDTIETNVLSTLYILEFAKDQGSQIIYAGSSSFYGGIYRSPYAFSKYQGEVMMELYNNLYGLNTSIARFYNVYGPNQIETGPFATVLGIWENQYRKGQPLTITGDGTQCRDFTHVIDTVWGLKLMLGEELGGDLFEFGVGESYSLNELAECFKCETKYIPAKSGEYDKTKCISTKAKEELGWEPLFHLKDYISKLL